MKIQQFSNDVTIITIITIPVSTLNNVLYRFDIDKFYYLFQCVVIYYYKF